MPRGQYDRTALRGQTAEESAPVSARAEETRRERRRRDDGDIDRMARMKLAIPISVQERLKREGKEARWVRDDAGRMQQMIAEDWDPVEGVPTVAASRTDEGQMVLMSKYSDWYNEDRRALTEQNNALVNAAVSGKAHGPDVDAKGFYAPQGSTNRISRGD